MEWDIFEHFDLGTLRAVVYDNKPYYSADDIGLIFSDSFECFLLRRIDSDIYTDIFINGRNATVVDVYGVYTIIARCGGCYKTSVSFKEWFQKEVHPVMTAKSAHTSLDDMLKDEVFMVAVLQHLKDRLSETQ